MSQEQFNTIVKLIRNGAPALAEELTNALVNVINKLQKYQEAEKAAVDTDKKDGE